MAKPVRIVMTTALLLAAASWSLRAMDSTWSVQAGTAMPLGGAKTWAGGAGSMVGPYMDIAEAFAVNADNSLRIRFGYFYFQNRRSTPQFLAIPGETPAAYPAQTSNKLFGFTYGAEWVHYATRRFYGLAGGGVTYLMASRNGIVDLSSVGAGGTTYSYIANNAVPYGAAGLGLQINPHLALEGRFQYSALKYQVRNVDLSNAGFVPQSQATFTRLSVPMLTLGLAYSF